MLYFVGTTKEVSKLEGHLPRRLVDEVCRGVVVLDAEMGEDRDYFTEGGYSLIAQTAEDLQLTKAKLLHPLCPAVRTWNCILISTILHSLHITSKAKRLERHYLEMRLVQIFRI